MNDSAAVAAPEPGSAARRAVWLLVALHVPWLVFCPMLVASGLYGPQPNAALAFPLAAVAIGLQLRHSLAAARGFRPKGWQWSFAALVLVAGVPVWWWGWDWAQEVLLVSVSAAMLLRGKAAAIGMVVPAASLVIAAGLGVGTPATTLAMHIVDAWFWIVSGSAVGGAIYGAAKLVLTLDDLARTRVALAEAAIGQERLRISRDLHDLLGHSLSAVALKGELADRLLVSNPSAARSEIADITTLARSAFHDVQTVAHSTHTASLADELDAAAGLLDAAGISARIEVDPRLLDGSGQETIAWAVREGTTNLLRHGDAQECSITLQRHEQTVRLEMINDGVRPIHAGPWSGLAGLAERVQAQSGTLKAGLSTDGRFRLAVELPAVEES